MAVGNGAKRGKPGKEPPAHIALVDGMLENGFMFVNSMPCVRVGDSFAFGWDEVHRSMLSLDPWSTNRTRDEAIKTLKYKGVDVPVANARFVGFTNGVLDVITDKLTPSDDFASKSLGIVPVVIPHEYDPHAEPDDAVEVLLNGISCGDKWVRMNLEEAAGLVMSRYADNRASAIWLYGVGENGKSTYLDALIYMVGFRNAAALMLDDLRGQFNSQMLVGKLLAIADDQPAGALDKSVIGTVKKLVTGQPIKVESKGKDPYNATMFATLVVTSNEPPSFADTTHGNMRRWHMIPLMANFGKSDSGRDVDLREKLHTEHAARWLIKLGVEGLRRILKNEGLTRTLYSVSALNEARERSNSVYAFLSDHPKSEILDDPNVEIWYWRYQSETKNNGGHPFEQKYFTHVVCQEYGLKTEKNGRYKAGDEAICIGGLARDHGRSVGDHYRKFIDVER